MLNKLFILLFVSFQLLSCKTSYLKYSYRSKINDSSEPYKVIGFREDSTFIIVNLPSEVYQTEEGRYRTHDNVFTLHLLDGTTDTIMFNRWFTQFTLRNEEYQKWDKLEN